MQMKGWLLVVVAVIVAAVAWKELGGGDGGLSFGGERRFVNTAPPSSPVYAQQQGFIDRLNADQAVRERFAGVLTSKGLYAEMKAALARGAQSIDGPTTVKMTAAMAAVVPRLSERNCAKLMREADDFDKELSDDADAAFARLPAHHHRAFWEFYVQALQAEVHDAPRVRRNPEAERAGWQNLGAIYTGRDAERMIAVMKSPARAADADACWAIKTLTHGIARLDPQGAEALARAMWAGPAR